MTMWKRVALLGFALGSMIALILIALVKVASHGHTKLWSFAVNISVVLFPTHIFLLPLSDVESFPHDLLFYLAAVIGNGVLYALFAEAITGLCFLVTKLLNRPV